MADETARWALPFIQPGQAQKEVFHNEALSLLDAAIHPVAETRGLAVPPSGPVEGQGWIVGASPTGDWTGHADSLAIWTAGGWRFVDPVIRMHVWLRDIDMFTLWTGSEWRDGELTGAELVIGGIPVVGMQQPAISDVSGGGVQDAECRGKVAEILAALQAHGLIAT